MLASLSVWRHAQLNCTFCCRSTMPNVRTVRTVSERRKNLYEGKGKEQGKHTDQPFELFEHWAIVCFLPCLSTFLSTSSILSSFFAPFSVSATVSRQATEKFFLRRPGSKFSKGSRPKVHSTRLAQIPEKSEREFCLFCALAGAVSDQASFACRCRFCRSECNELSAFLFSFQFLLLMQTLPSAVL